MFTKLVSRAQRICSKSKLKFKHVAFILAHGKIVCIGTNKNKTHPAIHKYPYKDDVASIHAELDAIIRYGKIDCSSNIMVVIRIRKDGKVGNSKPCKGCQFVINSVGFKHVYYSDGLGRFAKL